MRCVLVLLIALVACQSKQEKEIQAIGSEGKVLALIVPSSVATGSDRAGLKFYLEGSTTPMLGNFEEEGNGDIRFVPIVPLTPGLTYLLKSGEVAVGRITLPMSEAPAPELLAIYPLQDTVPENLLKIYLRFTTPMMEGRSASYVHLLKDGRDTMKGIFLDLQPELWNPDGTVLTLWLDPGRIKLDLIPNKELGNPLSKGSRYELAVAPGWRSRDGVPMTKPMKIAFLVGDRDDTLPAVDNWTLNVPASGTQAALTIGFKEALDRMLAEETIRVLDSNRQPFEGKYSVGLEDSSLEFVPQVPWSKGTYYIFVEARLEDLAGNNLNRLFETDLSKPNARRQSKEYYERAFAPN